VSFTLGQFGMVKHWRKERKRGWRKGAVINGFGAFVTLLTTIIILIEKFSEGAFIVVILIPCIVWVQMRIKTHYEKVACRLSISQINLKKVDLKIRYTHIVIVPIASLNKATIGALQYAQSISEHVIAFNISTDMEVLEKLKHRWSELNTDIVLIAKYSPFRAVVTPLLRYIGEIANKAGEEEKITVIVPEFVTHERWSEVLHNHTSFFIRETLLRNHNIIVSTYPYHLTNEDMCELDK
jgi:hypothetical protein